MPLGKVNSGTLVVLSIRLFQYWKPAVNWLIRVGVKDELTVRLATCRWLTVKFPSVKSKSPPLWSFRLLLAWVVTERYAECLGLMTQSKRPFRRFSKNGVGTVAAGFAPRLLTRDNSERARGDSAIDVCSRCRS